MPAIVTAIPFRQMLLMSALSLISVTAGCVTTTTATLESTVHSGDSMYRFQSCDATARVEIILTRN